MDCRSNICAERWSIVDDVNRSEEDIGSFRTEKEVSEYVFRSNAKIPMARLLGKDSDRRDYLIDSYPELGLKQALYRTQAVGLGQPRAASAASAVVDSD